eukprot:519655_1
MFGRSKSNSSQSEKVPLTPDHRIANKMKMKLKSEDNLISRSTSKAISISKILKPSKSKHLKDQQSFQKHLKHLDFTDKENKVIATDNMDKKEDNEPNEIDTKTKSMHLNCSTSSPFEYGCLFWEIEWNAIEIELKTKTNGVIRSVPINVGGHSWFVELYPRVNNQNIRINSNQIDDNTPNINKKKQNNTPNIHNCKFNIFVKSTQTPIYCKFAVYYTKQIKQEKISWKPIYCPSILLFKKNGAGYDKIVNFSDLCSLCVKRKLRLKIEFQVFDSVVTKSVQCKQTKIQRNLGNKIDKKIKEIRKLKCKQLLDDAKFSNVLLICNEKKFNAHACILSAISPKFAMLLKEKTKDENNMYSIDLEAKWHINILNGLLTFIYTQQVVEDVDLFELIKIADEYEIETLIVSCLFKLSSRLDTLQSNIMEILLWTQKYCNNEEIVEIENNCLRYMTTNLSQIISNKQFQAFGNKNPEIFQKLLRFMAENN